MSASRVKSLGKLVLLIGLPVTFVVGLFGAGVYVGQGHRTAILRFERDWLGREVEVPGEPAKPPDMKPETTPDVKPETKPEVKPEATPDVKPETKPETPEVKPPQPSAELPIAVAEPEPLPGEQARLAETRTVLVKVVVDDDVFDAHRGDWIAYAERHVNWASQVLARQLGVELELRGVVAWPTTWLNGQAALTELQAVGRDGADLVIGLGGRKVGASVQATPASPTDNAAVAVAFADNTAAAPHLRGLLRGVSHALGGDPLVPDAVPLKFDGEERRKILARKHLPFVSPVAVAAPPAPPTQPAEAPAEAPADEPEGDN